MLAQYGERRSAATARKIAWRPERASPEFLGIEGQPFLRMSLPDTLALLASQTQPILKIFLKNILYRKNAFYKIVVDILGKMW